MVTEDVITSLKVDVLRPLVPKPLEVSVKTAEDVPVVLPEAAANNVDQRPVHVFHGEQAAFAELGRVLHLVQSGEVRIQAKGRRPTTDGVSLQVSVG